MRSIDELATEIFTLAGHINAANHRFLTLIAEFDRRKGWSDSVTQSCAHWLNWKCGIALGAAREKVRVARALESLPKISAAMASGKVSYSKAREITRVVDAGNEDYLLAIAEHGTAAHVENLVRSFRRCHEAEELSREARQQQSRCVSIRHDDDGSMILHIRLPAESGVRQQQSVPGGGPVRVRRAPRVTREVERRMGELPGVLHALEVDEQPGRDLLRRAARSARSAERLGPVG